MSRLSTQNSLQERLGERRCDLKIAPRREEYCECTGLLRAFRKRAIKRESKHGRIFSGSIGDCLLPGLEHLLGFVFYGADRAGSHRAAVGKICAHRGSRVELEDAVS